MKQKRKMHINKALFFVLGLIVLLVIFKQGQLFKTLPETNLTSSPTLAPAEKFIFEIPDNWQTYTSSKDLGVDSLNVTFKYPYSWKVEKVNSYKPPHLSTVKLGLSLNKIHPKNSILAGEGLLPDNIALDLTFGSTSDKLTNFDSEFWGMGQVHDGGEKEVEINGVRTTIAYSKPNDSYPVEALFHLSSNSQIFVRIDFENTDPKCQTNYCKTSTDEINKILSSFKFTY